MSTIIIIPVQQTSPSEFTQHYITMDDVKVTIKVHTGNEETAKRVLNNFERRNNLTPTKEDPAEMHWLAALGISMVLSIIAGAVGFFGILLLNAADLLPELWIYHNSTFLLRLWIFGTLAFMVYAVWETNRENRKARNQS